MVIWIFAKTYGVLIFFAILEGLVAGTFWATVTPLGAEVVGLQLLPSALSIMWLTLAVPSTFAEPIALELRKQKGPIYLNTQIFAGMMYLGGTLCILILRVWKIGDNERRVGREHRPEDSLQDGNHGPLESTRSKHDDAHPPVRSKFGMPRRLFTLGRV